MLSPNAVLTPTAGTFALAQATEPIKDGKDEEIINIGETVLVHDEKGDEVVGEVFVMSGGGAGLAGRANKKFKSEIIPTCLCTDLQPSSAETLLQTVHALTVTTALSYSGSFCRYPN